MPRKSNWPPTIEHHASGYDRVRVTVAGHRHEVWLGRTGSQESQERYLQLLTDLKAGRTPHKSPAGPLSATVASILDMFIRQHAGRLGKEELRLYERAVLPVRRLFGSLTASRFGPDHLEVVRSAMASGTWALPEDIAMMNYQRRKWQGWARSVVMAHCNRVRRIWRWAERKRLIPSGSYAHLRTLEPMPPLAPGVRITEPRRAVDEEDFRKLLAHCHSPTIRAILELCWESGMRPGEARKMRLVDLDRSGELWICRPGFGITPYGMHKTAHRGHERAIVLNQRCKEILSVFLTACTTSESWIFPSCKGTGRPINGSSLSNAVQQARERAGLLHFFPYTCRHSAKRRVTRQYGIEAARAFLGQRSLESTRRYAAEMDLEEAKRVARGAKGQEGG